MITLAAISCMAEAIFFESRSEAFIAQVAVAQVIQHRINDKRFPDDACSVVHADGAFSYYSDGKSERISSNIVEQRAYHEALIAAALVALGWLPEVAPGSTHYYSGKAQPWPSESAVKVGAHTFLVGVR